jgi:hypothetical protein
VLPSLVIKIEYCRALHRGLKEPSRPGSLSRLSATCTPWRAEKAPISRFPATKKPSVSTFASAFLPGSAQYVESDVTHSKQTTATFLPGSRFAHLASRTVQRDAHSRPRTSLANALSNREHQLLEPTLTHRKQTIAPRSNRELSTNRCLRNSRFLPPRGLMSHRRRIQIILPPTI